VAAIRIKIVETKVRLRFFNIVTYFNPARQQMMRPACVWDAISDYTPAVGGGFSLFSSIWRASV
jgi:hypothetical protein